MWQDLNFICTTGLKGQVDVAPSINRKRGWLVVCFTLKGLLDKKNIFLKKDKNKLEKKPVEKKYMSVIS